jgi:hypothetical protein
MLFEEMFEDRVSWEIKGHTIDFSRNTFTGRVNIFVDRVRVIRAKWNLIESSTSYPLTIEDDQYLVNVRIDEGYTYYSIELVS